MIKANPKVNIDALEQLFAQRRAMAQTIERLESIKEDSERAIIQVNADLENWYGSKKTIDKEIEKLLNADR